MDYDRDRLYVLDWMKRYCTGFRNARIRADILPHIGMPDRYFRRIIHDLKKEGHIYSTNTRGYWFAPLHTNDPAEISEMKLSLLEEKSRALSLLEGVDKKLLELEKVSQGQKDFIGA